MSRSRERADRIRREIPLDRVLEDLGYAIVPDADREQQFQCDLHGDGSDSKPSARFYPQSNSWYCFACNRARDAINTVMEKQGMGFSDACKLLESQYNLPPLPWKDDTPTQTQRTVKIIDEEGVEDKLDEMSRITRRYIDMFTRDRTWDLATSLKLWEAYDRVAYMHESKLISDQSALQSYGKVLEKAKREAGA